MLLNPIGGGRLLDLVEEAINASMLSLSQQDVKGCCPLFMWWGCPKPLQVHSAHLVITQLQELEDDVVVSLTDTRIRKIYVAGLKTFVTLCDL